MGWRGTLRSIEAASRRIEREHQRQLKFAEKVARHQQKLAEIEQAQLEAEEFEETITRLSSAHRECGDTINWHSILHEPEPAAPVLDNIQERRALAAVSTFKPSFLDKLLRRSVKKYAELNRKVAVSKRTDTHRYEESYQRYLNAHSKWNSNRAIAHAILSGDLEAYEGALEDLQPFGELSDYGCRFNHSFLDPKIVQIAMTVDGSTCIPSEIKSLTARGKLSTKKIPQSKFNELYQDYVCGATLRVAREFFSVLPLEWVYCTAYAEMLNPSTGYKEITPVVSVRIPRSTLLALNFSTVDASDAMNNFTHTMGFKKNAGFTAIEPLTVVP